MDRVREREKQQQTFEKARKGDERGQMRCYLQFQLLNYLHLYPALRSAPVIQGMFIIQMSTERER